MHCLKVSLFIRAKNKKRGAGQIGFRVYIAKKYFYYSY